jgi:uncharacterized protein (TIGR03086 family)
MEMMIDLGPATTRMASLLASTSDAQLDRPTPNPEMTLGDLVDHVSGLTTGFTAVARKAGNRDGRDGPPPRPSAANLGDDWRERIARDLDSLAEAWRDPAAWEGMTAAAGVDLPGEVAGVVALDELVVHGWDIAVSSGQSYEPSEAEIAAATSFVTSFEAPRDGNLFGPVVPVPDDATPLDKLLGLTGRDPSWRP